MAIDDEQEKIVNSMLARLKLWPSTRHQEHFLLSGHSDLIYHMVDYFSYLQIPSLGDGVFFQKPSGPAIMDITPSIFNDFCAIYL